MPYAGCRGHPDNKVLSALDPQNDAKSDQSDRNIIPFRKLKRAENFENQRFQPSNKDAEDGT